MTTHSYQINEGELQDTCTFPALRELLPDYIGDQLGSPAAEALEDHLLECHPCREKYLEYLKLLSSAFAAFSEITKRGGDGGARASNDGPTSGGAKVLRLADFRRRQS
jgi:hypothetical protein